MPSLPKTTGTRVARIEKAMVWIFHRRKAGTLVLVLRMLAERGGFWQPVTGKIEPGESVAQGAFREALEETGLRFTGAPESLDYSFVFERPHWTDPHCTLQVTEFAFALEAAGPTTEDVESALPPQVRIDPQEHTEYEWLPIEEALSRVHFETNRIALEKLRARLGQA